jgi:hypothetical protein
MFRKIREQRRNRILPDGHHTDPPKFGLTGTSKSHCVSTTPGKIDQFCRQTVVLYERLGLSFV